ncbi:hypothetical protein SKAU_G00157650 [Synaphobranchus kaupii]|uniref:Uncharacterized protein n=1 Tax=Synaphobranchus kaupii TaxID=118154 RepID=A0A9Q1FIF3_SYNKA|nr:hypothetical protein SKAU_G00157650 [Synaphobranchus kaupii]
MNLFRKLHWDSAFPKELLNLRCQDGKIMRKQPPEGLPQLNESQHAAIEQALKNNFTVIQGPPDVVAEYLMKFGDTIKPLRVYSRQMEMQDYPYPGSILQFSPQINATREIQATAQVYHYAPPYKGTRQSALERDQKL